MPKTQPADDQTISVYADAITLALKCYKYFQSGEASEKGSYAQNEVTAYMTLYESALKELRAKKKKLERGW